MKYIYIISDGYKCKIGCSATPKSRMKQLQTANPNKLEICFLFETVHGEKLERTIQRTFSYKRTNGEWFKLDYKDIEKIKEMCPLYEKNLTLVKKMQEDNKIKFI